MAEEFSLLESEQRKINFRGNFSADEKEAPAEYEILLKNITIYDLTKAFKKILDGIKETPVHNVNKVNVTIDQQMQYIYDKLKQFGELHFLSLVEGMREKIRVVVTFIALLEMTKMGRIAIKESLLFNDFVIIKKDNGTNL
jgi:segregation and condensation protein A